MVKASSSALRSIFIFIALFLRLFIHNPFWQGDAEVILEFLHGNNLSDRGYLKLQKYIKDGFWQ
jgi:hypothetical protein